MRITDAFEVAPPLDRRVDVRERKGCDLDPIDATTDEGVLTLRSFVWADQLTRLALLDGAIAVARQVPAEVERIDAASFLERELGAPRPGMATVVYHSIVMQYIGDDDRKRIGRALDDAVSRATPQAPVYHLSMEFGEGRCEVRLGDDLLATSLAHGTGVRWLVSSTAQ